MITRFVLNTSLFASFITFVLCILTNISIGESVIRGAVVFVGFYGILIVFFIFLRYLFRPATARLQNEITIEMDDDDEELMATIQNKMINQDQEEEQNVFQDGIHEDETTGDKQLEKGVAGGQRGSG